MSKVCEVSKNSWRCAAAFQISLCCLLSDALVLIDQNLRCNVHLIGRKSIFHSLEEQVAVNQGRHPYSLSRYRLPSIRDYIIIQYNVSLQASAAIHLRRRRVFYRRNMRVIIDRECYNCTSRLKLPILSIDVSLVDTSKQERKRSVSRRPLISTIREWRSKEEPEPDPVKERLMLVSSQCYNAYCC